MLLEEIDAWIAAFLRHLPGRIGVKARSIWLHSRIGSVGSRPHLETGVVITGPKNIRLGNRFVMMRGGALYAHSGGSLIVGDNFSANSRVNLGAADGGVITIGDDVLIGPNSVLRASNHAFGATDRPIRKQGHTAGRITIDDDVWIGANVVVVPDVRIGAHSVVAAGAVVTKDVAPWSIVAGVPAAVIGKRA